MLSEIGQTKITHTTVQLYLNKISKVDTYREADSRLDATRDFEKGKKQLNQYSFIWELGKNGNKQW